MERLSPESSALYFDEAPLEHILYGQGTYVPAPANLFLESDAEAGALVDALRGGDTNAVLQAAEQLAERVPRLSASLRQTAASALGKFFPLGPKAKISYNSAPLLPLLERLWATGVAQANDELQRAAGPVLIRVLEHQGKFGRARVILLHLLYLHRDAGRRSDEASTLNNLGFAYLEEGLFAEALPLFEEAADLYAELGYSFNSANAKANALHCRFELGDWGSQESTRSTLEELSDRLGPFSDWYARKPLILLARLEEREGRFREAITLVKQAIDSAAESETLYPEEDRAYLSVLRAKRRKARRGRAAGELGGERA